VDFGAIVFNHIGFIKQDETDSSASRHNTERFVRCIEYERAPHHYLLRVRKNKEGEMAMFMPDHHSIACTTSGMPQHHPTLPEQHHGLPRIGSPSETPCSQQEAREETVSGCTTQPARGELLAEEL
jgi:hypothetical protein